LFLCLENAKRPVANLGHEIATDALAHESQGFLALSCVMQTNSLVQLGEFALNERHHFGDGPMLHRVDDDGRIQVGDRGFDRAGWLGKSRDSSSAAARFC
jgi:hypothetical protein